MVELTIIHPEKNTQQNSLSPSTNNTYIGSMIRQPLLQIAIVLFVGIACHTAHGQTSETNQRLRQALKQYPKADTNRDGILTLKEANAYRKRMQGQSNASAIKPDHADVEYGPHKRNRFDLWLTKSDEPTPLLICIHGGGFSGGDKSSYGRNANLIKRMHGAGISVASINYRLTEGGKNPYPAPMHDGARAVQFLRCHADKYNLDKSRFAATGGSAGGCISMWLGFHDDMKDDQSADPVLRESTRLVAIAPSSGQSTLHQPTLLKWFNVESLKEHGGGRPLFGIAKQGEIEWTPELDALSRDASPITHLTKDDPPCYMTFPANKPVDENSQPNLWVHHPILGFKLREAMKAKGLECYVQFERGPKVEAYESQQDFIIKMLTKTD